METIHAIVYSRTLEMFETACEVLAVRFDQESHEVASEGVSSIPGGNWARGFQKAAVYPSQ